MAGLMLFKEWPAVSGRHPAFHVSIRPVENILQVFDDNSSKI